MPNNSIQPIAPRLMAAGFATLLLLAGCAAVPEAPQRKTTFVYPPPPDEARFYYERSIYGSYDVAPQAPSKLKEALTGEGATTEPLTKPYAVAVHKGRVFVSDSVDRFVKAFDVPGAAYFRVGDEDPGALRKPLGIDVDDKGTLYVADATLRFIMVYDRDGRYLRNIGGPKMFDRLSSVTVEPDGSRVYVTEIGGVQSENHRVRVFDAVNGKHLFDIGKRGNGQGEFNLPRDLAIGKDGRLYVVDGGNFRVQVFDRDGKFVKTFGKVGKQVGDFARPKEVAADREGNIYVADTAFGNFQIFTPEGDLLMFVGDRSETDGPGRYMLPSGIYVDEDGRVYFVDQWFRKIDIFRPANLQADQGYLVKRAATPAAK